MPDRTPLPERIGPYRIVDQIGEGGMGTVYLGEQTEPIRRRVAVKVLKRGMDSAVVLARFEAERQALALMDHTSIAKVLDAGETEQGNPYFAMEWIKGDPITKYCDDRKLPTRKRLELFVQTCMAVQHAHQKGVIHRDLKPSNILVTEEDGKPVPKIIDFGIAKAISTPLTDRTLHTQIGHFLGTPEYMSPEQVDLGAMDVDTRTDIYSLGVVLYELLTGELPFPSEDLRRAGYDEVRRIIREQDPPRPSTRVSAPGERSARIAERRRTDIDKLAKELRHDLDWVILKALEKDRLRRYETATTLAQEIERFLAHEPVLASPPSAAYRMRKFVRRHRVGVGIASIVLAAVVATGATLTYALVESNRQRAAAEQARAEAVAVRDFLKGMLEAADPNEQTNPDITVREAIEKAAATAEERFGRHPLVLAEIQQTIGEASMSLGVGNPISAFRRAYSLRDSLLGPDDPATLASLSTLAICVEWDGDVEEGERLHRRTVGTALRIFGPNDSTTCDALICFGRSLARPGKLEEAESCLTRAEEILRRAEWSEEGRLDLEEALYNALFFLHLAQGDTPRKLEVARRATDMAERRYGRLHPTTITAKNNLAMTLSSLFRYDEAATILEQVLEDARQLYGSMSLRVGSYLRNTAECLILAGRPGEGESLFHELWKLARGSPEYGPSDEASVRLGLAEAAAALGRTAEAHHEFQSLIDGLRADPAHSPLLLCMALNGYARVLIAMDSLQVAVRILEENERIASEMESYHSIAQRRSALLELARVFDRLGEDERAEECRRELPAWFLEADADRVADAAASGP